MNELTIQNVCFDVTLCFLDITPCCNVMFGELLNKRWLNDL